MMSFAMEKLRTRQILDYLREKKTCTLAELMKKFKVSSATIHRDVLELTRRDAVSAVRGGLVFNDAPAERRSASEYSERVVTNRAAKVTLARKALDTVAEGDILFLDSSTTIYELAMLLKSAAFVHLTIVTNSVSILQNFRKFPPHWVLIGLGGNYDPQLNSILGAAALEQLRRINITKAYINALGTGEISKKQLDMTARFKEVVTYNRGESTLTNPDTSAGGSQTGSESDTGAGGSQSGSGSDTGAGGSQTGSGSSSGAGNEGGDGTVLD